MGRRDTRSAYNFKINFARGYDDKHFHAFYTQTDSNNKFSNFGIGPKNSTSASFGAKGGGTDADKHEGSENSAHV